MNTRYIKENNGLKHWTVDGMYFREVARLLHILKVIKY